MPVYCMLGSVFMLVCIPIFYPCVSCESERMIFALLGAEDCEQQRIPWSHGSFGKCLTLFEVFWGFGVSVKVKQGGGVSV